MIVCIRTVAVPEQERGRYLQWIDDGRATREAHGILAELVIEPSDGAGDAVVITMWSSHEQLDAWIATPARDALTNSDVHRAVDYRPLIRHNVIGGYFNVDGLRALQPTGLVEEQP